MSKNSPVLIKTSGVVWGAFDQKLLLSVLSEAPDDSPMWGEFAENYLGLPGSMANAVCKVVRGRHWRQSAEPWKYVAKRARLAPAETVNEPEY